MLSSSRLRPGEELEGALPEGEWKAGLLELVRREPPATSELTAMGADAELRPLRVTSAGVPPSGERGVIVVLTDTSLEKEVEDAIKRAERFEASDLLPEELPEGVAYHLAVNAHAYGEMKQPVCGLPARRVRDTQNTS